MTNKIIASALHSNGYYLDAANNILYMTAPYEKKSNSYGTTEYKLVCDILAQYPDVKISIQKKNRKHTLSYDMMKEFISIMPDSEKMLKEFIKKVAGFRLIKPRLLICVPSGITEVEERAVIDAGIQAGARKAYLIEEPVAAAIGAGIDITQPNGHMVVDIGGGTADIAVISLGGVVESASIKIAGDQLNESIVKYMRRKHNLLIGERTAEDMKIKIGCVFPKEEEASMEVKGRCLLTGLPKEVTVTSTEMMDAFEEPVERIVETIHSVLERTPPELVADISDNGITMTGGGSLVDGFDKLITARTGIHTHIAEDAVSCVAIGTGQSLDSLSNMQDGTMNLSRRRQMN